VFDLTRVQNVAGSLAEEDRKALAGWMKEREKALRDDPLNYGYPPHSAQLRVHQSTANEVLVVGANRSGKSTGSMREVLWRATMTHPYKRVRPCEMIWCGFVDFSFYLKVTKRLFDEWMPKQYLIQFHESEKWAKVKRRDGGVCTIYFMSYESGRATWQGGAVDYMWLDEECPQEIYHEATARLVDRRGGMLLSQTPLGGLSWLYDEIYLPAITGTRQNTDVIVMPLARRDPDMPLEVGEILVPHLDREQVMRLARAARDADERAIRIFGEFRGRSGGVYKTFDPQVHVVPPFKVPHYFTCWGGVDPGYHGFAAVCMAMSPQGQIYVPLEFFSQQESHTERSKALWQKIQETFTLNENDYFVFYCDTANPQDILELNTWSMQVGARMVFTSLDQGLKAREAGIQRVQEFLHPLPDRTTPKEVKRPRPDAGEPMLYFMDNLNSTWTEAEDEVTTSRLLWEIQRYVWRRLRRNDSHPSDADEKSAGGAHALAALRYGIMARTGPPGEVPRQDPRADWDPRVRQHMETREREAGQRLRQEAEVFSAGMDLL
jgi:phage terminase large subunit-like protein